MTVEPPPSRTPSPRVPRKCVTLNFIKTEPLEKSGMCEESITANINVIMYFRVCRRGTCRCVYVFILELSTLTDEVLHLSGWQWMSRNSENAEVKSFDAFHMDTDMQHTGKQSLLTHRYWIGNNYSKRQAITSFTILGYHLLIILYVCVGGQFTLVNGKGCIWKSGQLTGRPVNTAGF